MNQFYFNCDWGTSRFRLRLIESATNSVLAECRSEEGIASLSKLNVAHRETPYQDVLQRHLSKLETQSEFDLSETPVLMSGMASSSIGWRELPYAMLPFSMDGSNLEFVRLDDEHFSPKRPVFLFSGVCSEKDVMRGEEIELIGLAALTPDLMQGPNEIRVILPGTHSKHALIRDGVMVDFQTYMTGELYQLLGSQSSLRHRAGDMTTIDLSSLTTERSRWRTAFTAGVQQSQTRTLSECLFQVRTRQLLMHDNLIQSSAFLSGVLIGSELQALKQTHAGHGSIVLAAASEVRELYQLALDLLDFSPTVTTIDPVDMARLTAVGQLQAMQQVSKAASNTNINPRT